MEVKEAIFDGVLHYEDVDGNWEEYTKAQLTAMLFEARRVKPAMPYWTWGAPAVAAPNPWPAPVGPYWHAPAYPVTAEPVPWPNNTTTCEIKATTYPGTICTGAAGFQPSFAGTVEPSK